MTETMAGLEPVNKRPVFFEPASPEKCHACGENVYQLEKVGPINGAIYHRACMRCHTCERHLTLRKCRTDGLASRGTNDAKLVYCTKHAPQGKAAGVGYEALDIQHNLKSQSQSSESRKIFNEQVRGTEAGRLAGLDSSAVQIRGEVAAQMYVHKKGQRGSGKHQFPPFSKKKREILTSAQRELERVQRQEEDKMYEEFKAQRNGQVQMIQKEVDEEWEIKLKELMKQFDKGSNSKKSKKNKGDGKFEQEKEDLAKTMTTKRQKQIECSTLRLKEMERAKAADLVKRHSKQMIGLINAKQQELIRVETENGQQDGDSDVADDHPHDVRDDVTPDGSMSPVADENENKPPIKPEPAVVATKAHDEVDSAPPVQDSDPVIFLPVVDETTPPPPKPPSCSKADLYSDPIIFKEIDEEVFNIAENEQQTFTDLVDQLTAKCTSELEKARAIFRWITVKDLNVMDFDEEEPGGDTPHNLLRGIKTGTETYHVLFMRLCSFAGLHCVEIKGHSKSVGYEPGMKIRENTFLNTWNSVYLDGDWRIVQCNWGARHLVLNKDTKKVAETAEKKDKIRYQYDEHYFLTDPWDFILEFWPFDPEWQLLDHPISLEQFEQLPFVRSIFFHYNMQLEAGTKAVILTEDKGGAQMKIRIPAELAPDLVFHHQLRFADDQRRELKDYKGTKLERFVYQTTVDQQVIFSIHVPTVAEYFLEIFANKIDDSNRVSNDPNAPMQPFRLKCACKFRLVCLKMTGKMHPLPNCASGEWGSMKGIRHFDLKPLTYEGGVINEENDVEIKLAVSRPLTFVTKLHCNNIIDHILEEFVENKLQNGVLTVIVRPPVANQYGLDIFARPVGASQDSSSLAHACKYLINISHVDNPRQLPVLESSPPTKITKDKLGAVGKFRDLGLTMVSHPDYRIHSTFNPLVVELSFSEPLTFSYHLLREPDEDHRESVSMTTTAAGSTNTVKFGLNFVQEGNYLFAIYAQEQSKKQKMMTNVCNYLISHTPDTPPSPGQKIESTHKRHNSVNALMALFSKKDKS